MCTPGYSCILVTKQCVEKSYFKVKFYKRLMLKTNGLLYHSSGKAMAHFESVQNALAHITADPCWLCIMKLVGQRGESGIVGLFSLRCHLRKPPGLVKLSEWMECFFRRPRCTFFHCRTSVCLFLFQIHSIIPDCSKHSKTFCKPHILFFPLQPGSVTTAAAAAATLPLTPTPAPKPVYLFPPTIIPHHKWTQLKKTPSLSLLSPHSGILGNPHCSGTPGWYIEKQ